MNKITRRSFLKRGALAVTTIGGLKLGLMPRTARADWITNNFVVSVFLRGGMDGLNTVVPISGNDRSEYEIKRPFLKLPATGQFAALPLGNSPFGLHWAAAGLHEIFGEGRLAIVHATGMPTGFNTRSHFDAQDYMDHGTPGATSIGTGWLARHLNTAGQVPGSAIIPAFSTGSSTPISMAGRAGVMTLDDTSSFHPNADSNYADSHLSSLREIYDGAGTLDDAVHSAANTIDLIEAMDLANYTPAGGAVYPSSGVGATLGNQCKLVANVATRGLGLQAATIDFGGWDTHESQGNGDQGTNNNQYAARVEALSQALTALYVDLHARGMGGRLCVVVQSEFGRRVRENDNRGTDHGTGNPMFVLGGRVIGGLYGSFPGLAPGDLFDGNDVATTTDFRHVHAEIVERQLGNTQLGEVFPGYSYPGAMGFLPGDPIFVDGFNL